MSLLPRSTPAAVGVSSRSVLALLDQVEAESIELHSLVVVRRGHVVAEGWWAPYAADRPHLLYSLTKSFTSIAVGLVIADGLLALDDRLVDVLPEQVPDDVSERGRQITVHHLLSMTVGHAEDSLGPAWEVEPGDLVKGFLRVPFTEVAGTKHVYDNATTFILARMVERVTGVALPEFVQERLFAPMGIEGAEWDRVASGLAFGFHGLYLTTEAVAAFGELLLRGGRWGERQLVPRKWVELATSRQVETLPAGEVWAAEDFLCGYGYQFWRTRHGFMGNGAFGQQCIVVPEHDLVIAVTSSLDERQPIPGIFWDHLLPELGEPTPEYDDILAERLRHLSLKPVAGEATPRSAKAVVDASVEGSALPEGTTVVVDPTVGGWQVTVGSWEPIEVGYGEWRTSSPLGRPVVACGAWQDGTFVANLYVITTPHHVRLRITTTTAQATWNGVPLTGPRLERLLQHPLMTRLDVS